jgi:hypothetical protein
MEEIAGVQKSPAKLFMWYAKMSLSEATNSEQTHFWASNW